MFPDLLKGLFQFASEILSIQMGVFIFGFLQNALITTIGWRWTLIVHGSLCAVLGTIYGCLFVPLNSTNDKVSEKQIQSTRASTEKAMLNINKSQASMHYKSTKQQNELQEPEEENGDHCCSPIPSCDIRPICNFRLLKNPIFILIILSFLGFAFGYSVAFSFTPDRVIHKGISKTKAASLISIIGVSNIVFRIFIGWFADKSANIRFYLSCICLCGGGMISITICLFNSYPTMIVYAIHLGAFSGRIAFICFISDYRR